MTNEEQRVIGEIRGGTVTGVGSLPHVDPAAAVDFVARTCIDLPYLPSLPRRDCRESMLGQAATALRGVEVDDTGLLVVDPSRLAARPVGDVDIDAPAFAGVRAALDAWAGHRGSIKWQLTGPLTLASALTRVGAPATQAAVVAAEAVRSLASALHTAVSERMPEAQQVGVVDEPGHGSVLPDEPDTSIDLLSGALATVERGAMSGVHCCGAPDWSGLVAAGARLISVPVGPDVARGAAPLGAFLDAGGTVAWGVVPTNQPLGTSSDHWWRTLSRIWCELVTAGCDPVLLRTRSLVTPACGLALHTEAQAEHVMALVAEVAARVTEQAAATRLCVGA